MNKFRVCSNSLSIDILSPSDNVFKKSFHVHMNWNIGMDIIAGIHSSIVILKRI